MRCRLSFLSPSLYPPLIALHIKASDLLRRPQKGIVISYLVFRDRRHCKSLWFIPPNTESARSWLSAPEAAGCAMEGFQGPGCLLVSAEGFRHWILSLAPCRQEQISGKGTALSQRDVPFSLSKWADFSLESRLGEKQASSKVCLVPSRLCILLAG